MCKEYVVAVAAGEEVDGVSGSIEKEIEILLLNREQSQGEIFDVMTQPKPRNE